MEKRKKMNKEKKLKLEEALMIGLGGFGLGAFSTSLAGAILHSKFNIPIKDITSFVAYSCPIFIGYGIGGTLNYLTRQEGEESE